MRDKMFDNLRGIQREMLKLIGEVSSLTGSQIALEDAIDEIWHPKCDVFQTDNQWIVLVELAGLAKSDISISTTKEYLRVAGERNLQYMNCVSTYYSMEIETGRFDRRIFFPDISIDRENPEVTYENGILRIAFGFVPVIERIIPID
ncbi:MAG: Hsp20/alpha crystallin family protein [Candidatus Cloacimonadaceae bacterium]|nr:Hsp20/alpha crystallin family protein [Candidatus Cloacimonadaceae bacterium]